MIIELDLFANQADSDRIGPVVACIGAFDGVHRGHQFLVEQTLSAAQQRHVPAAIITFDIDPDEVLGASFDKILSNQRRLALLEQTGVNCVLVLPFTDKLKALAPEQFLQKLLSKMNNIAIVVGSNFRFGARAAGDVKLLSQFCLANAIDLTVVDLLEIDSEIVSSDRIRQAFSQGNIEQAEKLLGHSL